MTTNKPTKVLFPTHSDGPRAKRRSHLKMNNKIHTKSRLKYFKENCNNVLNNK